MSRKLAYAALALAAAVLVFGVWLAVEPEPRAAYHRERRGEIVSVVADEPVHEAGGFISQGVTLLSDSGLTVKMRLLRPGSAEGRLASVVLLGGHRTGRDAVKLIEAPGQLAVVALDYPYEGYERPRGFWQILQTIAPARRALADTPAAALLAGDWLARQPWADPARMEIAGVSLGTPFAATAGAIDTRFRRVWLIQGAADLTSWIEHNLASRIGNAPLRRFTAVLIHRIARGSKFEPAHWVPRISPRPVVIVAAHGDQRLPARLVDELEAAAREPKEIVWFEGDHIDRNPRGIAEVVDLVLDRIEGRGPVAAEPGNR